MVVVVVGVVVVVVVVVIIVVVVVVVILPNISPHKRLHPNWVKKDKLEMFCHLLVWVGWSGRFHFSALVVFGLSKCSNIFKY